VTIESFSEVVNLARIFGLLADHGSNELEDVEVGGSGQSWDS